LVNQMGSALRRHKKGELGSRARRATPGKAKLGWLLGILVSLSMLFTFTNIALQAISNMRKELGSIESSNASDRSSTSSSPHEISPSRRRARHSEPERTPSPPAPGSFLPSGVLQGATVEVALLLMVSLLVSLGSKELAQPDWDLEWLVTLPMPLSTLLGVRVVERTVVNPLGLLALGPFLSVLAWECGYRIAAPLWGLAVTFLLLLIAALVRTLVDTGLRLVLAPPKLRNLQALISVAGVLLLFLAISAGMSDHPFVVDWARALPHWAQWTPAGLAVRALTSNDFSTGAMELSLLVVEVGLVLLAGFAILARQLRDGVVATGGRETGGRATPSRGSRLVSASADQRRILTAIQARELRLLSRDRNFLVQTLLLPILSIGGQIFLNSRGNLFTSVGWDPAHLAAVAFGVSAYVLLFSAFQTLNAEGHALWILYCVPHSLESILRQKALLWSGLSILYPVIIIGCGIVLGGVTSIEVVGLTAIVLIGVPIYAVIATSLGVLGCDPLAPDVRRRVRISYLYLYMLLASLYVYAIYASSVWQRIASMVLTMLLALALWQKARDHLPYLLDPAASPPPRVSLSDGLIAAMMFFVFQALAALMQVQIGQPASGRVLLVSFSLAGAATFGLMRLVYWRSRATGVPRTIGPGFGRAALWGVGGGLVASIVGVSYLHFALREQAFADSVRASTLAGREIAPWLLALAVIAAPLFEEFIFRGLVFGGLRRSLGLWSAVLASAGIFAVVHPPIAIIPVFGLGICTALVYEWTGMLSAAMIVHAVYNAVVLGCQWLF
jgi:membrane protease YdiL (CAAX protease family)